MPQEYTLADVFKAAAAALKAGLHVSLPGRVESYDPIAQTANVTPLIRNPIFHPETGDPDSEDPVTIPDVMIIFPRGGGYHCSFPLVKGDEVTLVFSELATGQWRATGDVSEAVDVRRHGLGSPFAFPGAHSDARALRDPGTFGDAMVLGKDGDPTGSIRIKPGAVECGGASPVAVALGEATQDAFSALLDAVKSSLHAVGEGPAASGSAAATALEALEGDLAEKFSALIATITKGQ